MFSKATLLGTFVGFIVYYFVAWVFYEFIAIQFFEAHTNIPMNASINHLYIILGAPIQPYIIAAMYRKVYQSNYRIQSGFYFGSSFGLFVGFGLGLLNYGTMQLMDLTATLVDGVWSILLYVLVGAAIGWVFKATTPVTPTD